MISREIGPNKDAAFAAIALCVGRLMPARAIDNSSHPKKNSSYAAPRPSNRARRLRKGRATATA